MMVTYQNRRAVQIENNLLRLTVMQEGGHIAEILHKSSGVNPLWTPHWPSIEPSSYDRTKHPEYGPDAEAHLLSGILGHNICLDIFGAPSPEEARAGMPIHGEATIAAYEVSANNDSISLEAVLPKSEMRFKRVLSIEQDSPVVRISEEVENLSYTDRPIAWTQHVTLGSPFLQRGSTQFRVSATRSKVIDASFNAGQGGQQPDAEFEWPFCPMRDGSVQDLRVFPDKPVSAGFTAHLMNPHDQRAWFMAWSPESHILVGYLWRSADFPWLARWEENHLRTQAPWNGEGLACGMEFGVSPMVESRRAMVSRATLFGVPTFRWLPAKSIARVDYCAFVTKAPAIPEAVLQDALGKIEFP